MSQSQPPSLVHHFEPPTGFIGTFGWLCGYSADSHFLNNAVERFSRQTNAQRAYTGRIFLAILLDSSNPQISMTDVPGMSHLPIKKKPPFKLLHAKVGVLGFQHESDPSLWCVRLIVSTGNWTQGTLEDSLDLAWRVDVGNQDLSIHNNKGNRQACVDIRNAWLMLTWLMEYFDDRILWLLTSNMTETESSRHKIQTEKWLQQITNLKISESPQFFDNRRESLLNQLKLQIKNISAPSPARNYLGMGSGFYESSSNSGIPTVLRRTVESLQDEGLLTRSAEVDIFVNPHACQSIAHSSSAINGHGWRIRKAGQPDYLGRKERFLHAKFLFSASYRENSDYCNHAWLYLGSGNLTSPGFAQKMSASGGNLEAGVVIAPKNLKWSSNNNADLQNIITHVLPIQWDSDLNESPSALKAGEDMQEQDSQFVAAPVACLIWSEDDSIGWLKVPDMPNGAGVFVNTAFDVLYTSGRCCQQESLGRFRWDERRPRQVNIRWFDIAAGETFLIEVPVMDENGRFAGTALPHLELEDVWWQLLSFPQPPDDEDLPSDTSIDEFVFTQQGKVAGHSAESHYPARAIMQLIENIAEKQTAIVQADWLTWCNRLEQTLTQAKDSTVLREFRQFAINPLSPLWEKPFRPVYAETSFSEEGTRYEAVLSRLEIKWDVQGYKKLGMM